MEKQQLMDAFRDGGVVVENTRFLVDAKLPDGCWRVDEGAERIDAEPTEHLTADAIRSAMEAHGGTDGVHGEELRIFVSGDLSIRLAGIVQNQLRKQRRKRLRETLVNAQVHLGSLVFRVHDALPDGYWYAGKDERHRRHGDGTEDDLTLETVQRIRAAQPEGASWGIFVSKGLIERACMVVEELEDAEPARRERRPGIFIDDEDLEGDGFVIANTTFRIDPDLVGPAWRVEPGRDGFDGLHGPGTLTRNAILEEMDRMRPGMDLKPGRAGLTISASSDLHIQFLEAVRAVLAESIRRGWTYGFAEPGEATTFDTENRHTISGLSTEEIDVVEHVLVEMRRDPGGAVVTLDSAEKETHKHFVEMAEAGLIPAYVSFDDAAAMVWIDEQNEPVLATSFTRERRRLAAALLDAVRRHQGPLRTVAFDGRVEIGDAGEVLLPEQPLVEGRVVARELEPMGRSRIKVTFEAEDGSAVRLEGILRVDAEGSPGDGEGEPYEPAELEVAQTDLLAILTKHQGQRVSLEVEEVERLNDPIKHAPVLAATTPEQDLIGKIRVALTAAKLIQAERSCPEPPVGTYGYYGCPSPKNTTTVERLTEALAWAEQDYDEKRPIPARG